MKTIQLTITRNFRTHSDDVYLKETRERIVDLEDGEDATEVEQIVLQDMIFSFKQSYPHLRTNINFDEVIQVEKQEEKKVYHGVSLLNGKEYNTELMSEKIKSGTIEEQI